MAKIAKKTTNGRRAITAFALLPEEGVENLCLPWTTALLKSLRPFLSRGLFLGYYLVISWLFLDRPARRAFWSCADSRDSELTLTLYAYKGSCPGLI